MGGAERRLIEQLADTLGARSPDGTSIEELLRDNRIIEWRRRCSNPACNKPIYIQKTLAQLEPDPPVLCPYCKKVTAWTELKPE